MYDATLHGMSFACQPAALAGAPLEAAVSAALGGASVRRLAREHGLSRADAAGLARWAAPLCELYLGLVAEAGAPAGAWGPPEIVFGQSAPEPGARASAPPQEKLEPGAPAQDRKNEVDLPAPPAPPSDVIDRFEDVPVQFRTPELAAVYRTTLAEAMVGAT
jgi:hypothetical protein